MTDFDLLVIGAGSGGVRAARVASGHGAKVAIAEEYRVGGTCVIRGCVPKKLLVYGSHFAEDLEDAARFGWQIGSAIFDWPTLRDNVQTEVTRLNKIYTQNLTAAKVEILLGRAVLTGPNTAEIGGRTLRAGKILIATGAHPHIPDCEGAEHGITSNEAFLLEKLPERLAVIGGGYIATEFAGIFHELGTKVTLVNRTGRMLRGYDEQIVERLIHISIAKGIDLRLNAPLERVRKKSDGSLSVEIGGHDPVACDAVMFATGRVPNTRGLGLDKAGVAIDAKGAVIVDADNRSSVPSIYAVGDVTNRVQLTPVAIREGQAFADTEFGGKPTRVDYEAIPSAVFSHPPLAGVGFTEAQAHFHLGSAKVYASDFRPMKNVLAGRDERALYKLVVNSTNDEVVGAHMIGPDAPEILQMAAVAVKAKLTKAQFDACVAIHPTMAEELVLLK